MQSGGVIRHCEARQPAEMHGAKTYGLFSLNDEGNALCFRGFLILKHIIRRKK